MVHGTDVSTLLIAMTDNLMTGLTDSRTNLISSISNDVKSLQLKAPPMEPSWKVSSASPCRSYVDYEEFQRWIYTALFCPIAGKTSASKLALR